MAQGAAKELQFDDPDAIDRGDTEPALIVDVDGFAGPLDPLLELARRQKVDLAKISVLALAEQYLTFIEEARKFRLELAADYLVMAAWLAYLKSRLLLPQQPKDEEGPSAADLATALAFKLRRLEAMREVSKKMHELHQLGRDVFGRGAPEPMRIIELIQKNKHIKLAGNDKLRIEREISAPADRAHYLRDLLKALGQPLKAGE